MNDIRSIRICGTDETRPPLLRKQPYIDLYFRLSSQAPAMWCELFNDLAKAEKFPAKIDPASGEIIDTWVRKIDEIQPALNVLKDVVKQTTDAYLARLKTDSEMAARQSEIPDSDGEQGRLNRVIASLDFGE